MMSQRHSEKLLATPIELEDYYGLQTEIRELLKNNYRPYLYGLILLGPHLLRLLENPNSLIETIKSLCETVSFKIAFKHLKLHPSIAEDISLSLTNIAVLFSIYKVSYSFLWHHDPLRFYIRSRDEKKLMQEKPQIIVREKLAKKSEKLQIIKNHLIANPNRWEPVSPLQFFIDCCLFIIIDVVLFNCITERSALMLLTIVSSFLEIIARSSIMLWSSKRELSAQTNNLKLLRNLSIALKTSHWLHQQNRQGSAKYYYLSLDTVIQSGDISVTRKIMMTALIRAFDKHKIKNYVHTSSEIFLHPSVILSGEAINGIITSAKQNIADAISQEKLNQQLKEISKTIYGSEYKYFYPVTSDTLEMTDYLFVIKDGFYDTLKPHFTKMYGENNVKMVAHNSDAMLKVFAGARCEEKIFNSTLKDLRKPTFSNHPLMDVTFAETSETKLKISPPRKGKVAAKAILMPPIIKPEVPTSTAKIQTLNFGSVGTFKSNKENFPQPIEAPFYPPNTHFAFFRAPIDAFATEEQRDKFKNIRLHVVNGKGMKGLVAVGNYFFNTKEGLKKASFKLKDPSEDMRIYDYTLRGHNSDNKEVYLHVFEHVVAKAHK